MMDNDFIFQNTTKVYFGENQLENLPKEVLQYGKRVLITYGGGSVKKSGLLDKIKDILSKADIEVFEFGGIEPNPRHTTVNKGAEFCRDNKIDVLLAVGGGSTIDCTKVMAATAYYGGDCWDLIRHKAEVTDVLPIFTVLTLSATGSEMDSGGVISNIDTNEKLAILHPLMLPKVSFLDPTITYTVPTFQTAAGSADIIAHIFDMCYFNRHKKMYMLDKVMEAVLTTVIKYAPIAIKEPNNYEARANLMWASSWALNGFLIGGPFQATTCHQIEHELSAFYDITHGLGLAIVMPRWMEYVLDETTAPDFYKFGVNVLGVPNNLSIIDGAKEAIARFKNFLFKDLGLQSSLSEIGIDATNFKIMAEKACKGDVLHGYRDLAPKDVEKIFEMCL